MPVPCLSSHLLALSNHRRASAVLPSFWWASASHSQLTTAVPGLLSAFRLCLNRGTAAALPPVRWRRAACWVSDQNSCVLAFSSASASLPDRAASLTESAARV